MTKRMTCVLLLATVTLAADRPASKTITQPDAPAAFSRLKQLAGEWEAESGANKGARVVYTLIANGSAVQERFLMPNQPQNEMLTVYYLEGDKLSLAHYCMAGNQPRMTARRFNAANGELAFAFSGGSNIRPGTGHMHSAAFTFRDHDHFSATWEFVQNGKPKFVETVEYTRVR